jgi:two-component system, OmpR family, phosphate regulon sensor histidine kinase PhoR
MTPLGVRAKLVGAALGLAVIAAALSALYFGELAAVVFATLVTLGVALSMSWIAARLLAGRLSRLVTHTRDMSRSESDRRLLVAESDQMLSGVAGSIVSLSKELGETVDALARERDRFAAVLENMSEAVLAVDARQHITLVNRAAFELLELDSDPLGRPVVEVLRAPGFQKLLDAAEGGRPASEEFEVTVSTTKRVLAQAAPPQDTVGTVVVMHDVTELRRLETMRRDFVANVSHELRTPVSIIRATAETLEQGAIDEPEHAARFLEALIRNAERLGRIIADLLDISRIEAGEYGIEPTPLALTSAVQRTAEATSSQAEARDIDLQIDLSEDLCVAADPNALDQVLLNLIGNAVKYTGEGGHIVVRAHTGDGQVRVEIEDDGPGIALTHRDRIFERFYRVDSGRSREVGGTGLGLSIVKHLVTSMEGEIGYEAASPRGSIFWFTLPAC